jgi:23S rRNA (guanosine2251-2'-O)-methyltransferase
MTKKTKAPVGELIYGMHPVIEALKAKRRKLISIYTTDPVPQSWDQVEKLMPKYPVNIQYVKRDVLTRMAGSPDHQGIIAWTQTFPLRTKPFDPAKQPFLLMLDSIQDVGNLGAILRSAYCAGVDGVVLCKKNAAPLSAAAFKASAGLAEHLEIYVAASPHAAVQELKQAGYQLYMAAFGGENALKCEYKTPLCLVIGSEGLGITKSIINQGTQVTLPQRSSDISYNASVAAGILLLLVGNQIGKISL